MGERKVFVAGATGAVGRPAVRALIDAGHAVTAVARSDEKAQALREAGADPVAVDLFDEAAVKAAVAGHDAVVNLATNVPPLATAALARAWATNDRIRREAAPNLARAALAVGAEVFMQESVCFAYEDGGDRWLDESAPRADDAVVGSLWVAEEAAAGVTAAGARGVVLRFGQFYGPTSGHTIESLRAARRGLSPTLGPPEAYWPAIQLDDAGAAVVAALAAPGGAYHVADDEPLTRAQATEVWAEAVHRRRTRHLMGPTVLKLGTTNARFYLRSQRPTNAAFRAATGWAPRHPSLREGLRATVTAIEEGAGGEDRS